MPDIFDRVQSLAGPTMRGLASLAAPQICKGLLIEYLGKVKIGDLMSYVEKNTSLWGQVSLEHQKRAKKLVVSLDQGHTEWLTSEWAIEAVRKDLPRVASLFLGWKKARNWLDRQIVDVRNQLSS